MLLISTLILLLRSSLVKSIGTPESTRTDFSSQIFHGYPLRFRDTTTTLIRLPDTGQAWISRHGTSVWSLVEELSNVTALEMHPSDDRVAYALTSTQEQWLTRDQGQTWRAFRLPDGVQLNSSRVDNLSFHAGDGEKMILNAQSCYSDVCDGVAFYTKNGFQTYDVLRNGVSSCRFVAGTYPSEELRVVGATDRVLCVAELQENGTSRGRQLLLSDDWYKTEVEPMMAGKSDRQAVVELDGVQMFHIASMSVAASEDINLFVSVDGFTWRKMILPPNRRLKRSEYKIMDSSEHKIHLVVKDNNVTSTLFVTSSDGAHISSILPNLRMDWHIRAAERERMKELQGITIVSLLERQSEDASALASDEAVTRISFADAGSNSFQKLWTEGQELHLQNEFFNRDGSGVLMAVGNTGKHRKTYHDGSLFVSEDAGHHWSRVLDGSYIYDIADQGNLLLVVSYEGLTNKIQYTVDRGRSWHEFIFTEEAVKPVYLASKGDSASLQFLLHAHAGQEPNMTFPVFVIDFDKVLERTCDDGDMETFFPLGESDRCIMGQKHGYRRRRAASKCFMRSKLPRKPFVTRACVCAREDFECAPAFVSEDGTCKAQEPAIGAGSLCDDFYGNKSSGYRLILGNVCETVGSGAIDLESSATPHCSNAEISQVDGRKTTGQHEFSITLAMLADGLIFITVVGCIAFWARHICGRRRTTSRADVKRPLGKIWTPATIPRSAPPATFTLNATTAVLTRKWRVVRGMLWKTVESRGRYDKVNSNDDINESSESEYNGNTATGSPV